MKILNLISYFSARAPSRRADSARARAPLLIASLLQRVSLAHDGYNRSIPRFPIEYARIHRARSKSKRYDERPGEAIMFLNGNCAIRARTSYSIKNAPHSIITRATAALAAREGRWRGGGGTDFADLNATAGLNASFLIGQTRRGGRREKARTRGAESKSLRPIGGRLIPRASSR